jgi:glycerol-3-phosphate dehydrogenase (NAD(P)+)
MPKIAILGAGSWGTALSIILSRSPRQHEIALWARNADLADIIARDRENKSYLPGCTLAPRIRVTPHLKEALTDAATVVCAIPSAHVRDVFTAAAKNVPAKATIVSATKGLEPATNLRMSEVLTQVLTPASLLFAELPLVLSGPSFAVEAARGEPTAVVVAAQTKESQITYDATDHAGRLRKHQAESAIGFMLANIQEQFAAPGFRLYTNFDVVGVELAGAMKNVMAIAAGACEGLGLGHNAIAALVTRGLAEMTRLAVALGAKPETLAGLAGLGDLVLTCTGKQSRNRQVGVQLGAGKSLNEILAATYMVAEGVGTTAPLLALAAQHNVELPITQQVDAILHHGRAPKEAIREIMDRPQKQESA